MTNMTKVLNCLAVVSLLMTMLPCTVMAPVDEPIEAGWQFHIDEGVDYLSMPAIPGDANPDAVFGVDVEIFGYDPATGWFMPTALEGGKGYLVRCAEPKIVDITGTNVEGITWETIKANLVDGWNLIGPGDTDVTIDDTIGITVIVGWDAVADQWVVLHKGNMLQRGKGYWILKMPPP